MSSIPQLYFPFCFLVPPGSCNAAISTILLNSANLHEFCATLHFCNVAVIGQNCRVAQNLWRLVEFGWICWSCSLKNFWEGQAFCDVFNISTRDKLLLHCDMMISVHGLKIWTVVVSWHLFEKVAWIPEWNKLGRLLQMLCEIPAKLLVLNESKRHTNKGGNLWLHLLSSDLD